MDAVKELTRHIEELQEKRKVIETQVANLQRARSVLVDLNGHVLSIKTKVKDRPKPKKNMNKRRSMKRGDLKRAVTQAMTKLKSAHLEQITSLSSKYAARKLPKPSVNATLSEGKGREFAHDKKKGKGYWRYIG